MVAVVTKTGIRLMPTSEYRARRLLKEKKAVIFQYRPFTIRLLERETGETQPIEYASDTGYQNVGVSICTEKKELASAEYELLRDETERHNDRRKYRRARRNRKRYRAPRFHNRKGRMAKDGFAPSIRNRVDQQIRIFRAYHAVMPIATACFEMGQFDVQLLKALEEGKAPPEGADYQHGERYGYDTLREAVFSRDGYTCVVCGKSTFKDKVILRIHHLGYLKGDRSNRMSNLATVCTGCHTSKNHKPGGKLYGLKPRLKPFRGATFMTAVRFKMHKLLAEEFQDVEIRLTYGAKTKATRRKLGIRKSHANDAYCIGTFHPKRRSDTEYFRKRRRNNRILEKFYDARYVDLRDGKIKSGSQLSSGRTSRSESRHTGKDERIYRARKVKKGSRNIRRGKCRIQAWDLIAYRGEKIPVKATHGNANVEFVYPARDEKKSSSVKKIRVIKKAGGWIKTRKGEAGEECCVPN